MNLITASDIIILLRKRHCEDVFVSECKIAATAGSTFSPEAKERRMDAWVIKHWANPLVTGYEIKTHRGDFLQDNKWQRYLSCCHEFYFVCPTNLIQKEELPPEAGLMWVSRTGRILYTKKKAPTRLGIKIPRSIFSYILLHRAQIIDEHNLGTGCEKRFWKEWLKNKELDEHFGLYVSKAIKETVEREIDVVRTENEKLKTENSNLERIKKVLKELDIDTNTVSFWQWERKTKEKIEMINKGIPDKDLMEFLQGTIKNLQKIQDIYQEEV